MIKVAFSTLGCPSWNLKEILAASRDLGYDGVEIRGIANQLYAPKISEFSIEKIEETKKSFQKFNLEIPVLTSGANISDKLNINDAIIEVNDYIDLASSLNCKYVRVLADLTPEYTKEIDIDFVSNILKNLCKYAKLKNVDILIETNGFFAKSENLLKLLEMTNCTNLGVLWDIHHPYRYFGEKPEFTYNLLKNYIKHIHIKDSILEDGKVKYQILGYGDIPFKEAISLLNKNNFDGYICLEWVKRWSKDLSGANIVFPQFISTVKKLLK